MRAQAFRERLRQKIKVREFYEDRESQRVFGIPFNRDILEHSKNESGENIYVFGYTTSEDPTKWIAVYGTTFDYISGISTGLSMGEDKSGEAYEITNRVMMILNHDLSPKKIINKVSVAVGQLDRIPTDFNYKLEAARTIYVDLSSIPTEETPVWNVDY
tara:strand:+ start:23327 stop:23803 length:477 start_codon:yes stop_codon:yes gene_type:complete